MNLIQRIGKALVGNQDAAKALTRPPWWGEVWNSSALGEGGTFGNTPTGWRQAVSSNVWAYNCVKARMSLIAQAPLKLYVGVGDEQKEVTEHPVLDLLQEVNPINLNKRSFMRGIEQQLAIYGRCLVHKNRAIATQELFILPMEYVEVVPDERTWLAGYRWQPTGDTIPREDVIDFFYPSANGSVYADSPAAVALNSINRYNLADRSQASIDKRGGQKGGILVHPKDEISEDYMRIRDEWDRKRADVDSAGRDMHVPFGTDWRGDAFSATEMQREERNQRLAKEIMAAFSVPPAAAGDYRDASVLANAATQMSAFWEMWGMDELKFIAEELTYSLLWAEWKDTKKKGYYLEHDLSGVQALREDADARANRAIVLYQGGVASVNEARELAGFDSIDDPNADTLPAIQQAEAEQAAQEQAALDAQAQQDAANVSNDTQAIDEAVAADDEQVAALGDEIDSLLAEIDSTAAKAVGRPEKGDRDGDGIFNEGSKPAGGAKVSPVTGRSLAQVKEGPSKEDKAKEREMKKAEAAKQREQKKAESAKQREQKKAQSAKEREQKKSESQKAKEQATAQKKQAQIDQLDAEGTKLQSAYDSIKDRADVDPKLKQKVIDTMAKVKAKRDSIATGVSEGTSSVLQDVARVPGKAFLPVVDFVGMIAVDEDGDELGTIEKIHRFGVHDGIEATKAVPVVVINGQAHSASAVKVVLNGEEAND